MATKILFVKKLIDTRLIIGHEGISYEMYVCMRAHSTAVYIERRVRECNGNGNHLPNPVSISNSQHTTNTRALHRDWFYSRPMEAAEATMLADLVPALGHTQQYLRLPTSTNQTLTV